MTWALKQKLIHVLSQEQGAQVFAPGSRESFALVYPNNYHVGMSNLGFHIIYREINKRGDTACERFFLPDKTDTEEYIRTSTPLLSLENQRPLYEFPLIGFAVSFEIDYFHLLEILTMGKVALRAKERQENDPLVIIGGPCATFNPEPLAEIVDLVVIGEGEETVQKILDVYYDGKSKGLTRQELLFSFTSIPGVYVPSCYQPIYNLEGQFLGLEHDTDVPQVIRRQWIANLDDYPAYNAIVTPNTEFKNMFLVEIARGCGRHCRFCMAGYCFRKPRARKLDQVLEAVDKAKLDHYRVGLMGAAISDYPDIDALCSYLTEHQIEASVASLRADSLTDELINTLVKSHYKTITLAPEAGSERLRRVINKGITEQHLIQAITQAVKAGIPNIRLYLMVGLPFETDEDIVAIVNMAKEYKKLMSDLKSKGKLTLSINPFIPKPFTPFQWIPMADKTVVEQKMKYIQKELKNDKRIEILIEPLKEAYIQGVLARGDRKLSEILISAHYSGGIKGWKQALKEHYFDEKVFLYRARSSGEVFPWSHLDMGVSLNYLWQELNKATEELNTAPCMPVVTGCKRCGVCKEAYDET